MSRSGFPGFGGSANKNTNATIPYPNLLWSPDMKWSFYSADPSKKTYVLHMAHWNIVGLARLVFQFVLHIKAHNRNKYHTAPNAVCALHSLFNS
jgi:hypothetical protein